MFILKNQHKNVQNFLLNKKIEKIEKIKNRKELSETSQKEPNK
jgi:hypothetical protein